MINKFDNPNEFLCEYRCGQIAKFKFGNGKICCSDHFSKCIIHRKNQSKVHTGLKKPDYQEIKNPDNKLCDFGCGQIAHFQLTNGRYCCSNYYTHCPGQKEKISKANTGKFNN